VRISWRRRSSAGGDESVKKRAADMRVAVDSDPAVLKEKAFTSISARDMPFSSLAARM